MYGGSPPRQHRGHHHVFRGPDAGKVQIDVRAAQARALALDHAVRLAYLHAQRPQTLQVQVDGALADLAAAGGS